MMEAPGGPARSMAMTRFVPLLSLLLIGCAHRADTHAATQALAQASAAPAAVLQAPPDVARPPPDALRHPSGLASKVLRHGGGRTHPGPVSKVTVHYTGWSADGTLVDSSLARGTPATFPLNAVIPGWTEGVQLMVVGEVRRLWIPEDLAYKGRPGPPQGLLVFDIALLEFE